MNPKKLSTEFPLKGHGLYFNHAAISPWPMRTSIAVQQFAEENTRLGPARYAHWIKRENQLRDQLANLTGAASSEDIALLKNTTEGISSVAWGLDWHEGDNVVIPVGEFPSNRLPWLAQSVHGVEVREVDIRSATHAETALLQATDKRTRVLSVSAVQWSDGFRLDLETLGAGCKSRNVLFFVDAIQQLGALQMDVKNCHISFLAADAHKWLLGPEGIAVFYSHPDARPHLKLLQQGWHMFDQPFSFGRSEWAPADSARRFEAGSPNSLGQAAMHASIQLLLDQGMETIEKRILLNTEQLICGISGKRELKLITRSEQHRRSGIVSFMPTRIPVHTMHQALNRAGISCVIRGEGLRLSPHFYQGEKEIDQVLSVIHAAG